MIGNESVKKAVVPLALAAVVVILAMMAAAPALAVDNYAWVAKGPSGAEGRYLVCSSSQPGVVYAGTNGGVYKTSDYGDNWSYSGIRFRGIDALRGSSGCNLGLLAGASGDLFQSLDGGSTWNIIAPLGGEITAVLVTNSPACTVYAGTNNGVLNSLNRSGLPGVTIKALSVDSNNNVYAATEDNGIYKTTNDGLSWEQKNNGLPDVTIFSLKIDGSNRIFAGTLGGGVFRSTSGGDTWTQQISGLPEFAGISEFYFAYSLAKDTDGNLYAG
ncbi:MAG: hypothetical protein WA610_10840, partial [Thermodesulfovibrionales bacterium]